MYIGCKVEPDKTLVLMEHTDKEVLRKKGMEYIGEDFSDVYSHAKYLRTKRFPRECTQD